MPSIEEYVVKFMCYDTGPNLLLEEELSSVECRYGIHTSGDLSRLEIMIIVDAIAVDTSYQVHLGLIGYCGNETCSILSADEELKLAQEMYKIAGNISEKLLVQLHFLFPRIGSINPRYIPLGY